MRGVAFAGLLLFAARGFAQPPPGAAVGPPPRLPSVPDTELEPPAPKNGPFLPVPADATLVGQVRPWVGGGEDDRMFRSSWSYGDVVQFYDQTLRKHGLDIVVRRVEPHGVTYQLRRRDGRLATVVVRSTQPTTIETREPF